MKYVDNPFESPAILSICPGILGLERGLVRAIGPVRAVAYVEIETFAVENLVAGMEARVLDPAPIWTNLKTFDPHPFRGKVHGIIGGYPCQPFSTAGNRKGEEDPRHLWPFIAGIVNTIKPVWCFFENVSGHLTLGFDEVYKSLGAMGYAVEAGIFTAQEVGAPHQRERLFILGMENSCRNALRDFYGPTGRGNGQSLLRQDNGKKCSVRFGTASELANASSKRCGEEGRYFDRFEERLTRTSENVANADGAEWRQESSEGSGYIPGRSGIQREGEETAGGSKQCSPEVAHSDSAGLQEQRNAGQQEEKSDDRIGDAGAAGVGVADACCTGLEGLGARNFCARSEFAVSAGISGHQWPAGPGQPQQAWESPRIISRKVESDMGLSTHGYNFREDLLRALGNSVVEQTAELAFKTLLQKHLIHSPLQS